MRNENPFDVGMTGLLGFSSGYHAMMNSDVLPIIGTDFPYQQFYPKARPLFIIDVENSWAGAQKSTTVF